MPNGFTVFGFKIYFYGILIMLGALAAAYMAARQARKHGQDPETIWDMFAWVLIGGIVGARLWHILTPPASMVEQGITTMYYFTHPLEILRIRAGGLGIPGAVIGGGLALYIYTRRKKLDFGMWADFIAPGLALAQAIGRWGNFFNQEVYGKPSILPWAIKIDPQYRLPQYAIFETYHPLFLYECIWNLLNMGLLLYLGKRLVSWLKSGDLFLIYLMFYGVGRFFLEYLRLDYSPVAGVNVNQTVAAVVTLVSAGLFLWRHSKYAGIFKKKPVAVSDHVVARGKTDVVKAATQSTDIKSTKKPVKTAVKSGARADTTKTVRSVKTKTAKTR